MATNFQWIAVNNISNGKKVITRENFVDEEYNEYRTILALSMDLTLAPYLLPFNKNLENMKMDSYSHYLALFHAIPKRYRNTKFVSGKKKRKHDKDTVEALARYLRVRPELADKYLDYLKPKQRKEFYEDFIKMRSGEN